MREKATFSFHPFGSRERSHSHPTPCSKRSSVSHSRERGSKARRLAGTASVTLWQPTFGPQGLTSRQRRNCCVMRTHGSDHARRLHASDLREQERGQQQGDGNGIRGRKKGTFSTLSSTLEGCEGGNEKRCGSLQHPRQHPKRRLLILPLAINPLFS